MNLLVLLAALFGIEADALAGRLKRNAVSGTAIALFALIGIVFLLIALHTALVALIGPLWAPVSIALGGFGIALGVYAALRRAESVSRARGAERRHATETTALVTTAALTALPMVVRSPLARNVGLPLLALAAIALFGRSARRPRTDD